MRDVQGSHVDNGAAAARSDPVLCHHLSGCCLAALHEQDTYSLSSCESPAK